MKLKIKDCHGEVHRFTGPKIDWSAQTNEGVIVTLEVTDGRTTIAAFNSPGWVKEYTWF